MELEELRHKYEKAKSAYLAHRNTNHTNSVEKRWLEGAEKFLSGYFESVYKVEDSFLNFLGADFVVSKGDESWTVDLKVCLAKGGWWIMSDFKRKEYNLNEWVPFYTQKITDWWLFRNKDSWFLIPRKVMRKLVDDANPFSGYFLPRDLYQTTQKVDFLLEDIDDIIAG